MQSHIHTGLPPLQQTAGHYGYFYIGWQLNSTSFASFRHTEQARDDTHDWFLAGQRRGAPAHALVHVVVVARQVCVLQRLGRLATETQTQHLATAYNAWQPLLTRECARRSNMMPHVQCCKICFQQNVDNKQLLFSTQASVSCQCAWRFA